MVQREQMKHEFRTGALRVLLATENFHRSGDPPDPLPWVVNVELPLNLANYKNRVGFLSNLKQKHSASCEVESFYKNRRPIAVTIAAGTPDLKRIKEIESKYCIHIRKLDVGDIVHL